MMSAEPTEEPPVEEVVNPTAVEVTPAPEKKRASPVDAGFICSIPGLFKLVELIFVILGLIIVATIEETYSAGGVQIYILIHVAALVFLLLHYSLQLFKACQKLPGFLSHGMTISVACVLAWVLFLVSSAHILKYRYDLEKIASLKASISERLAAGGSFGIIVAFVFLAEAIFNFVALTTTRSKPDKNVNGQSNPGF